MGLDGVELVMAFEESFGISISDGEAEKCVTPGMVIDLICQKLRMTDAKTCQTQRAFYLLRRALMKHTNQPRAAITPATPLDQLLSRNSASVIWPLLGQSVEARTWPKLGLPRWLSNTLWVLFGILALVMPVVLGALYPWLPFVVRIVGLWLIAGFLTWGIIIMTRPLNCAIPRRYKTVADLVQPVLASEQIQWTRELVSKRTKEIVIEQLAIPESKYSESANFIRDLGMD